MVPLTVAQPCSGADIKAILRQALGSALAAGVAVGEMAEMDDDAAAAGGATSSKVMVTVEHITDASSRLRATPR